MADNSGSDSSAKRTTVEQSSRSAPITMYGNGSQLPVNVSHQLMPPMRRPKRFNEWKTDANDSDNPMSLRHSLPAQDYQNVTKQRGSRKN